MPRTVRTSVHDVATPVGVARVQVTSVARPQALLVLGHGAGRGTDTQDLLGLAASLPALGVSVVLVDQPWVLAGHRVASAPASLDVAWCAVVTALGDGPIRAATGADGRTPLVLGGRSAGARVACRTAAQLGADAVLLLAFPLVPPAARRGGEPAERARSVREAELRAPTAAGIALVAAQGERDRFGGPDELASALGMRPRRGARATLPRRTRSGPPSIDVLTVEAADHSLRAPTRRPDPAVALLVAARLAVSRARGE